MDTVESSIRNLHGPDVRLNRTERVVLGRRAGSRKRVEERRLPDVREALSALKRDDFPTFGRPTIPTVSIRDSRIFGLRTTRRLGAEDQRG